mmetsp:Transcript_11979/g.26127  ORF Transcript_11979/g.26127 Transcript_11979/m.26127 type:complete len:263 (+) Transcript_11979:59-847(+)|eukprot:CAMPEP_0185850322 /NCGR_PEP_ID=MMETSP1354-20130828/4497_1 /TAXON_ID=708628 /ORGANISM="Erythrolobus madagascarensis, Strain CCMP3276" /LENGTH=262 /DNA_ID=CAMNT_0028550989 /DNA_START=21 /DNA_END=809 /DNA_ORIENTATION=-
MKSAGLWLVAVVATAAVWGRVDAQFCRNATHCVCSSADFSACAVPASAENTCSTEPCSGWVCNCDGDEMCRYTPVPGYAVTQVGPGIQPCVQSVSEYVAPVWAFIMPSQFFCGEGCVGLFGTTADIPVSEELAASSAGFAYVNAGADGQVVVAMNADMETGDGCAEGTTNVIQRVHLHLSPDPENNANGPVIWTICDNLNPSANPCPTEMEGRFGTFTTLYGGDDLELDFATLLSSPESFYANFHTTCSPSGVVRGFLFAMS